MLFVWFGNKLIDLPAKMHIVVNCITSKISSTNLTLHDLNAAGTDPFKLQKNKTNNQIKKYNLEYTHCSLNCNW